MGRLKCKHRGKLSLVDCSAAAIAKIHNAKLITTDHDLAKVAKSEKIQTEIYELL
jgi:predicted nucleic acid-binding protein